jgi:hypothetical protein
MKDLVSHEGFVVHLASKQGSRMYVIIAESKGNTARPMIYPSKVAHCMIADSESRKPGGKNGDANIICLKRCGVRDCRVEKENGEADVISLEVALCKMAEPGGKTAMPILYPSKDVDCVMRSRGM